MLKGQTNFVKMLWKFNSVYNPERQYQEHSREVRYQMRPPQIHTEGRPDAKLLYIHPPNKPSHSAQPDTKPSRSAQSQATPPGGGS
jgi:hypothetical protein